ncbi:MAG: hypothetical protein ACFE0O_12280 [Opitutales bacterium]
MSPVSIVGVAGYGMNVWYSGLFDLELRLTDLKHCRSLIRSVGV